MHYENVGNAGWCLDGDGNSAYLHACGHGNIDYQQWTVQDAGAMLVKHKVSGNCLQVLLTTGKVTLGSCNEAGVIWTAVGKNGWVKFVSNTSPAKCLRPDARGRSCVRPTP
ncbi:ricin-type beta-trefoil lectin domain protein [Actinoplanes sp. GCM10030250]|uniref:ricin-type beta-trefoil lectin domain protein n=1 Tax=Actinoplanes sp. GCM10030250 TaxID=3273376 RepID=UPI00360AE4B5